ncbi:MAG: tail fiber domain-containing protein [Elusimicrobia bacterium]|nr:tail fiber domain-containing protein [Elusimicrobiota bacterium]
MKSRKRITGYLGTLLACAAAGIASAAAPDLISYQGRLQENNALVNGNRSVNIRLCDAIVLGNCYSTGVQGVAVSNGIFRTTFTTNALPPGGLESGVWFIEVVVSGNALAPREQFASAPYSLVASSVSASGLRPGVVGAGVNFGGNVGIGTTGPASRLDLGGGCMTGSICSDARLKKDIRPLSPDGSFLEKVLRLHGASFEWKNLNDGKRYFGLIAQDVEKVVPEVVMTSDSNDNQKGLSCVGLDAVLVEAIKEQQREIVELKAKLDELMREQAKRR